MFYFIICARFSYVLSFSQPLNERWEMALVYYIKQKPLEQASTRIRNVSSDNLCAFLMRFVIFTISKRNERTVLDIYIYKRSRPIYSTDLWSINDRIANNRVRKKSIREELILPTDFLSIFKPCVQLLLNLKSFEKSLLLD